MKYPTSIFSHLLILLITLTNVYKLQAQCPKGSKESRNLIKNGDFTKELRFFHTDYQSKSIYEPGQLLVDSKPNKHQVYFRGKGKKSKNDKFLIINGSDQKNAAIWSQTIKVVPNTDYKFSMWITTLYASSFASLQVTINGKILDTNIGAPYTLFQWKKFEKNWFSGQQTSATIRIVNLNLDPGGNDFGIDEIRFTYCIVPFEVNTKIKKKEKKEEGAAQTGIKKQD